MLKSAQDSQTLQQNQDTKIDLNHDGNSETLVRLESLNVSTATLFIKSIAPQNLQPQGEPVQQNSNQTEQIKAPLENPKSVFSKARIIYLGVLGILIISIILIVFLLVSVYRYRKRKAHNAFEGMESLGLSKGTR